MVLIPSVVTAATCKVGGSEDGTTCGRGSWKSVRNYPESDGATPKCDDYEAAEKLALTTIRIVLNRWLRVELNQDHMQLLRKHFQLHL